MPDLTRAEIEAAQARATIRRIEALAGDLCVCPETRNMDPGASCWRCLVRAALRGQEGAKSDG